MSELKYTAHEMMICQAARQLRDGDVVFVGIGLPNLACNLARRLYAPRIVLIYESGAVGAVPERLPLSIGDPALVTNSLSVCPMFDIFSYYLQGGLIDVGFLQGAQIDRFGNLNTTVVGDYEHPQVRLPGSGGACEIAILAKKVLIIAPQSRRSFPAEVDFITSPGFAGSAPGRTPPRMTGGGEGPSMVITNLASYNFPAGEMTLSSLHPGATLEDVRRNIGWEVRVASHVGETAPPSSEELRVIREELDPSHLYI